MTSARESSKLYQSTWSALSRLCLQIDYHQSQLPRLPCYSLQYMHQRIMTMFHHWLTRLISLFNSLRAKFDPNVWWFYLLNRSNLIMKNYYATWDSRSSWMSLFLSFAKMIVFKTLLCCNSIERFQHFINSTRRLVPIWLKNILLPVTGSYPTLIRHLSKKSEEIIQLKVFWNLQICTQSILTLRTFRGRRFINMLKHW